MKSSTALRRVVLITTAVTVAALGTAALIGLASGGFRPGQFGSIGTTVDDRKTVSLDGIDTVSVEGTSQDVRIVEGTSATLEAWLHGTAGTRSAEAVPRLSVDRSGGTLIIRVDRNRDGKFWFGTWWGSVALDVSVPPGYAKGISVKTSSGNVRIADHNFVGLDVSTTSGDTEVGTVSAPVASLHSTSGTITVTSITGAKTSVSTTSGDVRVKSLSGDATLSATSGRVNVAFVAVPARVEAHSTSGDVTLRFPADAEFLLDAQANSGDITCRFPITISQGGTGNGRHALKGAVGGAPAGSAAGGSGAAAGSAAEPGQVMVRTRSGDIRIEY